MIDLRNKKIGIWGLGVVGASALKFIQQFTNQIQILDKKPHDTIHVILQTPETTQNFLDFNAIIIPSPGISLLPYSSYEHKFLHELDIFAPNYNGKTIAITGTLGKTTVTSFIHQCIPHSIAAGNIGYAMLDALSLNPQPSTVVLELSSYQLQYTKAFAPDLAIWTNFYPNHLDHHATIDEYFLAKCNVFKHQTSDQIALIPLEIINKIKQQTNIQAQIYLFAVNKPTAQIPYPTFYITNNALVLEKNNHRYIVFDHIDQLPNVTFMQNWIMILAALHLHGLAPKNIASQLMHLQPQEHRVEFVKNIGNVAVYNDSKSTVWQATKHAIERFPNKKIALCLGGLSKGTDRSPLIANLSDQAVTVFAFGAESEILGTLCKQYHIPHTSHTTLEDALKNFMQQHNNFDVLLFSPAGSSFDLFKNYQDRGIHFKKLIFELSQNL